VINALKYTQSGGKVGVYTFMENGCACLWVSDAGIGIAPADLSRLGERFYRVDKARSCEAGSHGLGLSIARGIIAAHRCELTLTSEPDKGTSVCPPHGRNKPVLRRTKAEINGGVF